MALAWPGRKQTMLKHEGTKTRRKRMQKKNHGTEARRRVRLIAISFEQTSLRSVRGN
jgi:hypothetical protein